MAKYSKKPKKDPKLAQAVRDRIKKWDDYWRFNRTQYHEWNDFIFGDMWKEDESKVFTRYNKIPLTFNKLGPLASYMLGEQLQNTPNLQVCPDENVPEETAETHEALVKHIMLDSDARLAYQFAFQSALIGGFGAFTIGTEYETEYSFDLDIKVYIVKDPTRCYWDMSAESPCKTDGMSSGNRTRMSREKFRGEYGEKVEAEVPSSSYTEDTTLMSFNDDDSVTIIDDYEREYDEVTIYKLSDGRVIEEDQYKKLERVKIDKKEIIIDNGIPLEVVDQREAPRYKIIHRKLAGDWVLETTEFPATQLPVIFVDQNSYWDKNGKQICRPFFKDAKDAQRYLNYLATQSAYIVKVSRYDQFIASKANVKSNDTQAIWRDPATQQGALVYDESPNGNKPEQLRPAELPMSLISQYERTLRDIETSTGVYGTQVGQQGNEVSGAAVDARTKQGSYNTYVPYNSINRAIAVNGQIISEMIPRVNDGERKMMLRMSDQMMKPVELNKPVDDYSTEKTNDMTQGRYKIRLMPGPSYEGQKAEARESMEMILKANPGLFSLFGDMYAENLPLANNIELRNRIRTIIDPAIIEAGKTGKPLPPKPPQEDPMVKLKQMELQLRQEQEKNKMQVEQMKAQERMAELTHKQAELQLKAQGDNQSIAMEWQKIEAEKLEAAAKLQERQLQFEAEMRRMQADIDMSHADNISKLLIHAGDIHNQRHIQFKEHEHQKSMPKPVAKQQ